MTAVGMEMGPQPGDNAGGRVWIVVQSKVGQERRAARELEHQGFEVYLPMRMLQRKRLNRVEDIPVPFLPRYLFARVTLQVDHWKSVYRTLGVHTVLGGMHPIGVADWVIRRFKVQEDGGFIRMGLLGTEAAKEAWAPELGKRVRVSADNCDIEGLFLEVVDEQRALILVSLLGRDSRVRVDLRKIKALAT